MEVPAELFLAAPFRTALNTRTVESTLPSRSFANVLANAAAVANKAGPGGWHWSIPGTSTSDSELRYTTLDDDLIHSFSRPLLTLSIGPECMLPLREDEGVQGNIEIVSAHADYYDNTVAVLWVRTVLGAGEPEPSHLQSLDRRTTLLCTRLLDTIKPIEFDFLDLLKACASDNGCGDILLDDSSSVVFADAPFSRTESESASRLLWTSRVLHVAGLNSADDRAALETWTCQPIEESRSTSIGANRLFPMYGNSVSVGRSPDQVADSLVRIWVPLLAGYAVHDVLQASMRKMSLDMSASSSVSKDLMDRVDRTMSFINYTRIEYSELVHGLQGVRRAIASEFLVAWRFDEFADLIAQRQQALMDATQAAIQARNRRYATLVEGALALIGGTALLDLALSMLSFSRTGGAADDSVPGVLDVTQWISADFLLYVIMVLLLCLLAVVIRSRQ